MRKSGGAGPGVPTMPTDEISFWPENSSCWAPGTVRYTLSWAARAVRSSTRPTTRSFEAPISTSAPTGRPIVVDTMTSSGVWGARPSFTAGAPGPCSGTPNTLTFRGPPPAGMVDEPYTSGTAAMTPGNRAAR